MTCHDNPFLTIAICTRNREADLRKCLQSIARQQEDISEPFEVLLVDDGALSSEYLDETKRFLKKADFRCVRKEIPGLYASRRKAVASARGEVLLFLDDDIVLESGYLKRLLFMYRQNSLIAGVGGVDVLLPHYSLTRELYTRLFLYNSGVAGRLSITGLNASMYRWNDERDSFVTEYLNGCNMSFRTEALSGLPDVDFFSNYSLGEDIFISLFAQKSGRLYADPALKVRHFQTDVSRDRVESVATMKIVNHWRLLPYLKKPVYRYVSFFWTCGGMMLASLLKKDFEEFKGYLKGLGSVVGGKL